MVHEKLRDPEYTTTLNQCKTMNYKKYELSSGEKVICYAIGNIVCNITRDDLQDFPQIFLVLHSGKQIPR